MNAPVFPSRLAIDPELIVITVAGVPVAKGRPKLTTKGTFARAYTPAKTRHYEDRIRCEAANIMGDRKPLTGPVTLSVTAYVPIPKSFSKRARAAANEGLCHPITRPDTDNYAKAALDALNSIVFRDDSQVTDLIVRKRYADRPRLVVTIEATEAA